MSDSKPTPPKDQKADSFLGRLSVVIFSSALLAILVANFNLPDPNLSSETRGLLESLRTFSLWGWLAFFVIIYLSGRRSEVEAECFKVFGTYWFDEGFSFWTSPGLFALLFYFVGWFFWIPLRSVVIWVNELFFRS